MDMTATEKLDRIERYVREMYPIYRPAILLAPEKQAFNDGFDAAMAGTQEDLLHILEDT